ncbi:MAG: HD domain-containing protein [Sumerlaeia bacterium]
MPREKLYRDPIHDLIVLDLEWPADALLFRLIDTPEVQRLRRVRQLGMANFAFHGAEHSRFSHCIGVMHMARRILFRLGQFVDVEPLTWVAVQCAALLHDIGHGPFSHVIENFFDDHHEHWTVRILLDPGTEVHQVLADFDPALPRAVADLIEGRAKPGWVNRIVSSQLDADRFDYLLRDSHMTGVKYGIFDLERLLLMLRVHEDGERIFVSPKGVLPVEKYLQSRYQMYRQVYFHKTVTAAEAMLMAILDRACVVARDAGACPGVEPDSPFGRVLCGASATLTVADYLQLDDSVIMGALGHWSRCGDRVLNDLARRLLRRRLFKSLDISNATEDDFFIQGRIGQAKAQLSAAGFDPRYYLLFSTSSDTPYRPYNPRGDKPGQTIWVQDGKDPALLKDVKEVSPTVNAFVQSPYTIWRAFFPPEGPGGEDLRGMVAGVFE